MKKRIQITVTPVDNGYTIQAQSSEANGQNPKNANMIAKDDAEVRTALTDFIESATSEAVLGQPAT